MSLQQSAFSSWWLLGCRRCWKHGWASKNSPPGFSFPTKKEPSGWTRCSSRWELFSKVRTKYMTIILYSLALAFCERVCAGPAIQNDRASRWGHPQVSSLCFQHNCSTNLIKTKHKLHTNILSGNTSWTHSSSPETESFWDRYVYQKGLKMQCLQFCYRCHQG